MQFCVRDAILFPPEFAFLRFAGSVAVIKTQFLNHILAFKHAFS